MTNPRIEPLAHPLLCSSCNEAVLPDEHFCEGCGAGLAGLDAGLPSDQGLPTVPVSPDLSAADFSAASTSAASTSAARTGRTAPLAAESPFTPSAAVSAVGRMATTADSPAPCRCGDGTADTDGYCGNCGRLIPPGSDHVEIELGDLAAVVSDRGLRHARNEDAACLLPGKYGGVTVAIADGVSTSVDPHKASAAAVRAAVQVLVGAANPDDELLDMAVTEASAAVADVTDPAFLDGDGNAHRGVSVPACTLVAAHVLGAQITVVSVGDSRAYWIPEQGDAEQLSVEDSWAAAAILGGAPPDVVYADRRSHQITAWIGIDAGPLSPHITRRAVTGPGTVIICSDGLWTYLPNLLEFAELVRRHLAAAGRVALNAARSLTEFARSAGGHDNITVAVLTIPGR